MAQSPYVTLNKAVGVEAKPSGGSQAAMNVVVTYQSGRKFGTVMESDRFVKFLAVVRKNHIPVTNHVVENGEPTLEQQARQRITIVDSQAQPDHIVKVLFKTRQAATSDFTKVTGQDINAIILDSQIVIDRANIEGLVIYINKALVERKPSVVIRGNQLSFSL